MSHRVDGRHRQIRIADQHFQLLHTAILIDQRLQDHRALNILSSGPLRIMRLNSPGEQGASYVRCQLHRVGRLTTQLSRGMESPAGK